MVLLLPDLACAATFGKKRSRKSSMEVTPPMRPTSYLHHRSHCQVCSSLHVPAFCCQHSCTSMAPYLQEVATACNRRHIFYTWCQGPFGVYYWSGH